MKPRDLIWLAFDTACEAANAGHSSFPSLHDLPPESVAEESDAHELYRTQTPTSAWYLVGKKGYYAPRDTRAELTMFSVNLPSGGWDHLPTQEEHDAGLRAQSSLQPGDPS